MKLNQRKFNIAIIGLILILGICFIQLPLVNYETKIFMQTDVATDIKISGTYENITIDNLPGSWNNWTWAENQEWCTGLGTLQNPYILQGHTFGILNAFDGIRITNSHDIYFIIEDCTFIWNGTISTGMERGILLSNTTHGEIIDNTLNGISNGFMIYDCEHLTFTNNTIFSTWGALALNNCNYTVISDNTMHNTENGIGLSDCYYNTINNNNVYDNEYGIYISYSKYNNIFENTANDNNIGGIYLAFSEYHNITENSASGNNDGIYLEDGCNYNNLSRNDCQENKNGIDLYYSDFNTIEENYAINNDFYGISLEASENNTILGNQANNNSAIGIRLTDASDYNSVSKNTLDDNEVGIYFYASDNNSIIANIISDSNSNGIYYDGESDYQEITENIVLNNTVGLNIIGTNDYNLIYKNFFLRNGKHAYDDGTENMWNSTSIGNYWDNHTGPDLSPQDGIVDISYNISGSSGSKDFLPIADDVEPSVIINTPSPSDVFGTEAPKYDVTVTDTYLYEMWYTLDGGVHNYTITESTGTIDQSAWDIMSDGTITLTFHASDKPGNVGTADVNIVKDATGPIITIYSPTSGVTFGTTAPSFMLTVTDAHLDSVWYSLDNGLTNYTITTNTTINQAAWAALSEGSIIITFYANDTVGNLSFEEVTIIKEIPTGGIDPTTILIIVVVSVVGGVAVIAGIYIIMKKRATPE